MIRKLKNFAAKGLFTNEGVEPVGGLVSV